jgi:repressor LexA
MRELHPTQERLLDLLKLHIDAPLTVDQLKDELDASSKSLVHHHIQQLEKRGYLKRNPHNPKDYVILGTPDKPVVYIFNYGKGQCGPSGSMLDGTPVDRVPIASRLLKFPAEEAFIIEATGNSMLPSIQPGDLVIARKGKQVENGEMIVCVNKGEVLIKKYFFLNEQHQLHSINTEVHPFTAADDFKIEGVVKTILQYH